MPKKAVVRIDERSKKRYGANQNFIKKGGKLIRLLQKHGMPIHPLNCSPCKSQESLMHPMCYISVLAIIVMS